MPMQAPLGVSTFRPGRRSPGTAEGGVGHLRVPELHDSLTPPPRSSRTVGPAPVFVVTHSVPYGWPRDGVPVTFVTDGIESALQRASSVAGDGSIAVTSPSLARQYLNAGLLDGIRVSVVPVLLGNGVRFFDGLTEAPVELEFTGVVNSLGATHLSYRVCGRHR